MFILCTYKYVIVHTCLYKYVIPVHFMYIDRNLHICMYMVQTCLYIFQYSTLIWQHPAFNYCWIIAVCITPVQWVVWFIKYLPKSQFPSYHGMNKYIHVYAVYRRSTYWHLLCSQRHFMSHQAQSPLRRPRVSAPRCSSSFWAASFLSPVFFFRRYIHVYTCLYHVHVLVYTCI
jgi:hypothetical protein